MSWDTTDVNTLLSRVKVTRMFDAFVWKRDKKGDWRKEKRHVIEFDNGSQWVFEMGEIGHLVRVLGDAEDEKYPFGRGRFFLLDYLSDVITDRHVSLETHATKYNLSVRQIML